MLLTAMSTGLKRKVVLLSLFMEAGSAKDLQMQNQNMKTNEKFKN